MPLRHLNNEQIDSINRVTYQTIDAIGEAWTQVIRDNLDLPAGGKVLDAGCGTGFLTIVLARMGYAVTALDISQTALDQVRRNAELFQVSDRVTCCHSDTAQTPLPAGSFDAVVSRHASALFLKPISVYEEWYRLLKPEGALLNFDANWLSPLWDEDRARAFLEDEQKLRETVADYTDMYHDRYAIFRLSQYPLSYEDRPHWDEQVCRDIGYRSITSRPLTDSGMLPPVLAQRFRSIPSFLIRAFK